MLQTQTSAVWSGLLVCSRCLDPPNPQERIPRLRPDPVPIKNPRPVKDGATVVPSNWPPLAPLVAPPLVLVPASAVSGIGSLVPFIQMSVSILPLTAGLASGGAGSFSLSISGSGSLAGVVASGIAGTPATTISGAATLSGTAGTGRTGAPTTSTPALKTLSGIAATAVPGILVPTPQSDAFSSGFSSGFS